MANDVLRPLSRIGGGKRKSPGMRQMSYATRSRNLELLLQGQEYWTAMDKFRHNRERNKRYLYGEQWDDKVWYKDKWMKEKEVIMEQGNVPLKNNLIRIRVNNVIGLYRNQDREPTCIAREREEQRVGQADSALLQYVGQLNQMGELRAREMEEFLMSGLVVERKWFGRMNGKEECWTAMVDPYDFIIDNNMADPRGWDCSFVGQIHDISFEELLDRFAHSREDREYLRQVYVDAATKGMFTVRWTNFGFGKEKLYNYDFFCTSDKERCRVVEIWRKETKERFSCHDWNTGEVFKVEVKDLKAMVLEPNERRLAQAREVGMPEEEVPLIDYEFIFDSVWMGYFLSPFGDVLWEGETEYDHGSHPYVFKCYPFINGEIHSFVEDAIDQQRFINRLIIMHDMAVRSSAKGLMMVPIECIPDGMDPKQFAEESTSYRGMMFYRSKNVDKMPTVITSNSTNIGTAELLKIQLSLIDDITGVHGALQGKTPVSGTSGTLYAQETQNATTGKVDILMCFDSFVQDGAYKDLKNALQYYDDKKIMNIIGGALSSTITDLTPEKIRDVEVDISIQQSQTTPVYREINNEMLTQLWQRGQIGIDLLLKHGTFPFADELLQDIEAQQQEQAAQQQQQQQAQGQAQQPQAPQQVQVQQPQGPSAEG